MKHRLVFALVMGMITTCLVSFSLIAINVGFRERFIAAWLKSWGIAYVVAVSSIMVLGPRVQGLINRHLEKP